MRVAVLEWICGGGLLSTPLDQIAHSLIGEGQAMLLTIVNGLAAAAHSYRLELFVPIDRRLFSDQTLAEIGALAHIFDINQQGSGNCLEAWEALAKSCQSSWLIAPEIDDRLAQVARTLRSYGCELFNCDEQFLRNASNKFRTAQLLRNSAIPHPPTNSLDSIDEKWLDEAAQSVLDQHANIERRRKETRWIIKPADGAGSQGVQIVDRNELLRIKHTLTTADARLITQSATDSSLVQPMLSGVAASCSAVIDRSGQAHWLPLVSQDFIIVDLPKYDSTKIGPNSNTLRYLGCTFPALGLPPSAPQELLTSTISAMQGVALGWVGIDLLYDPRHAQWWVIEINPRCTSSLVGLAAAYDGNLIGDMLGLQTGNLSALSGGYSPISFRVNGHSDMKSVSSSSL